MDCMVLESGHGDIETPVPTSPSTTYRQAMDVSVELAACQLLLGDAPAAEATLGLGPGQPGTADPGVREYVLVRPSSRFNIHWRPG